jgi:hypothetical protein
MLTVDVIANSFNQLKDENRVSVPLEECDLQFLLEDALKSCNLKFSKILEGKVNKRLVYIIDK